MVRLWVRVGHFVDMQFRAYVWSMWARAQEDVRKLLTSFPACRMICDMETRPRFR